MVTIEEIASDWVLGLVSVPWSRHRNPKSQVSGGVTDVTFGGKGEAYTTIDLGRPNRFSLAAIAVRGAHMQLVHDGGKGPIPEELI